VQELGVVPKPVVTHQGVAGLMISVVLAKNVKHFRGMELRRVFRRKVPCPGARHLTCAAE
jgi:hypothetical protein